MKNVIFPIFLNICICSSYILKSFFRIFCFIVVEFPVTRPLSMCKIHIHQKCNPGSHRLIFSYSLGLLLIVKQKNISVGLEIYIFSTMSLCEIVNFLTVKTINLLVIVLKFAWKDK